MIEHTNVNISFTRDFSSNFIAPDACDGEVKYDIYSIGQMIYYLMSDKFSYNQRYATIESFNNDSLIYSIYSNCIKEIIEERISIMELMFKFFYYYRSQIKMELISKDPYVGYLYEFVKSESQNTSLDKKNQNAQVEFYLGVIYFHHTRLR